MNRSGTIRPRAEVVPTHTPALFAAAVQRAAERLRAGDVVAVPTETVYGLAANALDAKAVRRIFAAKDRPGYNPVIVHVVGGAMARECVAAWPPEAERLAAEFWPGPLTLVLPRAERIPPEVSGGGGTVGVRWPSHPFMQALILACGFPLAAPSANRSNEISPTQARHVLSGLGDRVGMIVDGGQAQVGIESTVIDLTQRPPRVLRPGMLPGESLAAALDLVGELWISGTEPRGPGPLSSPGQLPRHYAPRARVLVRTWNDEADLARQVEALGVDTSEVHIVAHHRIPGEPVAGRVCVIPSEPEAYGRALYAEWHRCDELGARVILVEAVPGGAAWRAIADRIARASSWRPPAVSED